MMVEEKLGRCCFSFRPESVVDLLHSTGLSKDVLELVADMMPMTGEERNFGELLPLQQELRLGGHKS